MIRAADDSRSAGRATRRRAALALALVCAATATACVHGHRVLRPSHAGHNRAVQTRIEEELLLNLVRLRYRDSPLFLRIGSVVVQFELSAAASAGATLNEGAPGSAELGAGIGAREQPTFTFTPLQDDEFVRRLLRPMGLDVIMLLQRSGWSVDRVMRLMVQGINGLDNAASASGPTPDRPPRFAAFRQVSAALRTLQLDGVLALGYVSVETALGAPLPVDSVRGSDLVEAAREGYRFDPAPDGSLVLTGTERRPVLLLSNCCLEREEVDDLVELLGLASDRRSYELIETTAELDDALEPRGTRKTIALAQRSLLGTLFYLSQAIDVPAPHLEAGLVTVTKDEDGEPFDWTRVSGDLLRVRSARERPPRTAVAVPYRGHWFYIDDADLSSKSTFALLGELFALQSTAASDDSPVLTLPVGG